jgi:hypothetical protein
MTTTATAKGPTATAATPIVALDLGKYKSVACLYEPATVQARFQTLDTTRENLLALLQRSRPGVVVFEACLLPAGSPKRWRRKREKPVQEFRPPASYRGRFEAARSPGRGGPPGRAPGAFFGAAPGNAQDAPGRPRARRPGPGGPSRGENAA